MVAQIAEIERPWTFDDLAGLPDDRNRYEILQGELIVSCSPGGTHQIVLGRLSVALEHAAKTSKFGTPIIGPFTVRFSASNVAAPDLLAISVDQYPQCSDEKFDGAPAFITEVVSSSSVKTDRQRKAALYMEYGVQEYWVVEPDQQRILVHLPGDPGPRIVIDGSLQSVLIPTMVVELATLFAPSLTSFE